MFKTLAHPEAIHIQRMIDLYENEIARTEKIISKTPTPDITKMQQELLFLECILILRADFVTRLVKLTRRNPMLRKQFYQNAPAPIVN